MSTPSTVAPGRPLPGMTDPLLQAQFFPDSEEEDLPSSSRRKAGRLFFSVLPNLEKYSIRAKPAPARALDAFRISGCFGSTIQVKVLIDGKEVIFILNTNSFEKRIEKEVGLLDLCYDLRDFNDLIRRKALQIAFPFLYSGDLLEIRQRTDEQSSSYSLRPGIQKVWKNLATLYLGIRKEFDGPVVWWDFTNGRPSLEPESYTVQEAAALARAAAQRAANLELAEARRLAELAALRSPIALYGLQPIEPASSSTELPVARPTAIRLTADRPTVFKSTAVGTSSDETSGV